MKGKLKQSKLLIERDGIKTTGLLPKFSRSKKSRKSQVILLKTFRAVIKKAGVSRGLNSSSKPVFKLISALLTLLIKESKLTKGYLSCIFAS